MEYNALALSNGVQRFSFFNQKTPKAEAFSRFKFFKEKLKPRTPFLTLNSHSYYLFINRKCLKQN
ncbi:MAG: hypothetical protein KAI83_05215 [Thiomargarita sp.]|nr:hypothetical protein [Thiomargarita sp.]